MKVYLAGPIHGCTDEQAYGWRSYVRIFDPLGVFAEFLDPMERDYRGFETDTPEQIVSEDKADIDACDVLLANCWKPSWGTAMEILYARERNKVVVVVTDSASPWLAAHADFVTPSLESACQYVHLWGMVA